MHTPTDLYRAGRLQLALDAQLAEVKAHPADAGRRLFLFELAAFSGDDARARRQLDALPPAENPGIAAAAEQYRMCLDADAARRAFFESGTRPGTLEPAPEHVKLRFEGCDRLRTGHPVEAAKLFAQADEACGPVAGALNGAPFSAIRDADDRLGPVLEVFARGKYLWVGLDQLDAVVCNAPKFPRDLLWFPAKVMAASGEIGDVFLPTLYAGSGSHADEAIKLGRTTDWNDGDGPAIGFGAKLFFRDEEAHSLLDWRQLEVNPRPEPAE